MTATTRKASLFEGGHVTWGKVLRPTLAAAGTVIAVSPAWDWPVARLIDVHDGDTVRLNVDQGWEDHGYRWIRLLDVFAPELNEAGGVAAKLDCAAWFTDHAPDGYVRLTTYRVNVPLEIRLKNSFTRTIGTVRPFNPADTPDLNTRLLELGYTSGGVT
jgi:endonuclease YncB( thermonuclease family)